MFIVQFNPDKLQESNKSCNYWLLRNKYHLPAYARGHSVLIIITTDTIPNILAGYILIAEEPEFFSFAAAHGFDFFAMLIMIPLFRFHVMTPPKNARVRMLTIGIRPKFSAFLLPSQKVTTTKTRHAGTGV